MIKLYLFHTIAKYIGLVIVHTVHMYSRSMTEYAREPSNAQRYVRLSNAKEIHS